MPRRLLVSLRAALSLATVFLSPGLSSYQAAAQAISAPTAAAGETAAAGLAGAAANASPAAAPVQLPIPLVDLALTPVHGSIAARPTVRETPSSAGENRAGARQASASKLARGTFPTSAPLPAKSQSDAAGASPAQAPASRGTFDVLADAAEPKSAAAQDAASAAAGSRLFDGRRETIRRNVEETPVAADNSAMGHASGLRATIREDAPKHAAAQGLARPALSGGVARAAGTFLAAALLLAVPWLPATAPAAATPGAAGASAAFLASIHLPASVLAAAAGALYGLLSTRKKEDPAPSAGQVLASALRCGFLGSAGIYILLAVSQTPFLGFSAVGLHPLPAAVVTAALGQSAFQGQFAKSSTSTVDRIMGTFPAVAAALGLSAGTLLSAASTPNLLSAAAVGAMSVTGVAAALYAAIYDPGKSAPEGPAAMARGYVLQSLMAGLALAVRGAFAWPFMALAAWGFWGVISTTCREALSLLAESVRGLRRH